jgi:hypothetical protein
MVSAIAGDEAPGWLREFSTTNVPAYPAKVPAVVLLAETAITVEDNGRVTTTVRKAVKVLTRDGRNEAHAMAVYFTSGGKVKDFRAWMIRPSGEVKKYGKEKIMDIAVAPNDVYNEVRARAVTAESDADPGAVFGYEAITEERSVFTQFEHSFQNHLPALLSRFSLTLPAGWRAEVATLNGNVTMQTSGSTYTWELRNLPYIEDEVSSPSMAALSQRIAVSYIPPDSAKAIMGRVFTGGWPDVSRWLAELEDPQAAANGDISEKARALTAGAPTELDRIRAIGHYVQTVRYVSIQTGLGRGGGYKPHSAAEVFLKQYGDCKDKANLMRTMLKVAGIPSFAVSIYSGDPTYVRENWPSPQQFNHAIIAVKVGDATVSPAIADVPKLGRLLYFDPTDENTPLGDLPEHEQGSFALLDDASAGALVRMPVIPAAANRVERETEIVLAPDGSVTSKMREQAFGQSAASMRYRMRARGKDEYVKVIERWVASGASGAKVTKVEPADAFDEDRFDLRLEFAAERYAQLMQGRLLVFRAAMLPRRGELVFTETKRQNPVVMHASSFEETVKVKLPAGFKVDEIPDGGKVETAFGTYISTYTSKDGELVLKRKLEIRPATVAVAEYGALKTFCELVAGAEQQRVVLVKD